MPQLKLSPGLLGRPRLDLPPIRATNCYVEKSPGGPSEDVRTSRPGLTLQYTAGVGPILRTYQKPGLFSSNPFHVSGSQFYMGSSLLGSVAYSQNPRMAAANGYLALVVGGALYIYDGTSFYVQSTFDDGYSLLPPFSGVAVLYNIFVFPVVGSNQFFYSSVGNPSIINAANFGAAQTSPTPIVEVAVNAEELYFFKTDAVEIWDYSPNTNASTGQVTAVFVESQGRTYSRGCLSQGSVALQDNALFWVGDDFAVYRSSTVPQRVTPTTSYVEDRLKAIGIAGIEQITSFAFNIEAHAFYGLNLTSVGETYVYDCQTQQWFRWGTQTSEFQDPGIWAANTISGVGDAIYAGDGSNGNVYLVDETNHTDNGTPIRVVFSGAHWIAEGVLRANNLALQMVRGVATPNAPDPQVWMRWSEDGGRTWTSWRLGSIGPIGGYRWKVSWHSLGLIRQPGREFEFAIADAVNVTVESATLNPARR